jgi:DNA-binding response OmpR family regulator
MPLLEGLIAPPAQDTVARPIRITTIGTRARILSVSNNPQDHFELRRILDNAFWEIAAAHSCREAVAYLSQAEAFVLFCEHSLPDGSWKQMLDDAARLPKPPLVVVTSRLADDYLWAEVLNLGGFDVLAKPLNEREVRHVLDSAWLQHVKPVTRARMVGTAG